MYYEYVYEPNAPFHPCDDFSSLRARYYFEWSLGSVLLAPAFDYRVKFYFTFGERALRRPSLDSKVTAEGSKNTASATLDNP